MGRRCYGAGHCHRHLVAGSSQEKSYEMHLSTVSLEDKGEKLLSMSFLSLNKGSPTFLDCACLTARQVPVDATGGSIGGAWAREALLGCPGVKQAGFFMELATIAMEGIQGEIERIASRA